MHATVLLHQRQNNIVKNNVNAQWKTMSDTAFDIDYMGGM